MPSLPVLKQLLIELTARKNAHRTPEPNLIMDDPDQVAAFEEAGGEDGVMAPLYLFHCAHVCEVVRPGDHVVDLGCGPANQLAMIARVNPDTQFIGVDLSGEMLERAQRTVDRHGLRNVTLRRGDISELADFADSSIDAVYSTVVLHHLADAAQLERTLRQVDRILRPQAGLYIADFGHLRTERAIHYFARQYAHRQPPMFTTDYLNSLRAAFELDDWRRIHAATLSHRARLKTTFAVPYMVAIKSLARRAIPPELATELHRLYARLPAFHKTDFRDLASFFRLGGLPTPPIHRH